jgi:cation diffusion facilitator CzcD-associated flavoprotein CzcO
MPTQLRTPSSGTHPPDHLDVVIVGAGLSGIGAACHLQKQCPNLTFAILEGRHAIGGTWDLFRYPGIRSDSDMHTLGYSFRPWTSEKSIADGPSILEYVKATAREHDVEKRIRFGHRLERASWSSADAKWTLEIVRDGGERTTLTCNFLHMCSGYYRYDHGHRPDFPGSTRFRGRVVHPQEWTEDVDYENKRVVVIGSGATAVSLVPELAKKAAHVTMLQRSPTYMVAVPEKDRAAAWLRERLPGSLANWLIRWKNVIIGMIVFQMSKRRPRHMKRWLLRHVREQLGAGYDVATHFKPRYNPWDQRMCLVRNGDLFAAIRKGSASVVTDHVETFTEHGIRLRSGAEIEADLIVTATGLELLVLGGVEIVVDGRTVDLARTVTYKGMMFSDVPNLASSTGYTNASWTLKCDLTSTYVCRLLTHMEKHGLAMCTPRFADPSVEVERTVPLTSGYIQRSLHLLPKQGSKRPWRLHQNYALDVVALGAGRVQDGVMEFRAVTTHSADVISIRPPSEPRTQTAGERAASAGSGAVDAHMI